MKFGPEFVSKYDLSSLRVLGSVGEPINPAAWHWYDQHVGRGRCAIVDTFWQTETGGHMITALPGAVPTKPGCATLPFLGVEVRFECACIPILIVDCLQVAVLDPTSGAPLSSAQDPATGLLVVTRPWPGLGRTIQGDHERYLSTYMGYRGFYFTGDGATIEPSGYVWINGRVDDVLNVSGHRLGTAELENALVNHPACPEAAVIAVPHDLKWGNRFCFAISLLIVLFRVWCFCICRPLFLTDSTGTMRICLLRAARGVHRHARAAPLALCTSGQGASFVSSFFFSSDGRGRKWGPLRGPRRWCCARRCPRLDRAK